MINSIMPDSIAAKHLTADLRRRLLSANASNESVLQIVENDNLIEIPLCAVITDTNILLDGSVTTIQGVDITNAYFICINGQTDKTENGIYKFDFTRWEGLRAGMPICVNNGDYQTTIWQNVNNAIDLGTTNIEFVNITGGSSLPDGTETGTTLFWNGTDWVENKKVMSVPYGADGDLAVRYNDLYTHYVSLFAKNGRAGILGQTGTYSSFRLGYASVNEIFDIYVLGSRIHSVKTNGRIFSSALAANTVLLSNASKEIVSLAAGTANQILKTDGAGTYSWGNRIYNKAVYLASTEVFNNLQVLPNTEPLPAPITPYRYLGDPAGTGSTIFKLDLIRGKKYKVDISLKFPYTGTTAGYHQFQFKVMGGPTWDSLLWWNNQSPTLLYYYPNITLLSGSNGNQSMPIGFNVETAFIYENDSGVSYATLNINGIVSTNSDDGSLRIYLRNIYRAGIDNSNPCLVAINSYMSAIECE